jgi:hypothetical protein
MTLDLKGKQVMVVGAGGGIGFATVQAFVQAGARVVAAGRVGPTLAAAASVSGAEAVILDILDADATDSVLSGMGHSITWSSPLPRRKVVRSPASLLRMPRPRWRVSSGARIVSHGPRQSPTAARSPSSQASSRIGQSQRRAAGRDQRRAGGAGAWPGTRTGACQGQHRLAGPD